MYKKKINHKMQLQVREYMQYFLKETIINDHDLEEVAINLLSNKLRN